MPKLVRAGGLVRAILVRYYFLMFPGGYVNRKCVMNYQEIQKKSNEGVEQST